MGNLHRGVPDLGLPAGEYPGVDLERVFRGSGPGFACRGVPGLGIGKPPGSGVRAARPGESGVSGGSPKGYLRVIVTFPSNDE